MGSSRTTPVHRYPNVRSSELSPQSGQTVFGPPKSRLLGALVGRSTEVRLRSKANVRLAVLIDHHGHEQTSVGNHRTGEGPISSMQTGFAKPKKQKGPGTGDWSPSARRRPTRQHPQSERKSRQALPQFTTTRIESTGGLDGDRWTKLCDLQSAKSPLPFSRGAARKVADARLLPNQGRSSVLPVARIDSDTSDTYGSS